MSSLPEALATVTFRITSVTGGEFTFRPDFAALFQQIKETIAEMLGPLRKTPSTEYPWVRPADDKTNPRAVRAPSAVGWFIPETSFLLGTTGFIYRVSRKNEVVHRVELVDLGIKDLQRLLAGLRSMTD